MCTAYWFYCFKGNNNAAEPVVVMSATPERGCFASFLEFVLLRVHRARVVVIVLVVVAAVVPVVIVLLLCLR